MTVIPISLRLMDCWTRGDGSKGWLVSFGSGRYSSADSWFQATNTLGLKSYWPRIPSKVSFMIEYSFQQTAEFFKRHIERKLRMDRRVFAQMY